MMEDVKTTRFKVELVPFDKTHFFRQVIFWSTRLLIKW